MTFTIETLIGTARDVCEFIRRLTTLFSLQLEHIEINALLTSSEIKEFASRVFFKSLENIESSSESSILVSLFDISYNVITAFLLKLDLRLSTNFITSGTSILISE